MKASLIASLCAAAAFGSFGVVVAQQGAAVIGESEVIADPVSADVTASAVAAVAKLGDEVVLGRYHTAIERMNPHWKERAAKRMGGMEVLEKQLAGVAAQMVQQGVSMISFKPQGQPTVYQVSPGKRVVKENGAAVEKLVYTQWLVLVPTVTKFRILKKVDGQVPKQILIESVGYQVALSEKGRNDWTFIDGAGLSAADLRALFITLPKDMKLPTVEKREVR